MSTACGEIVADSEKRARKLAAARKKLQTFRASQSSTGHHSSISASVSPSHTRQSSTSFVMPLTTEVCGNAPHVNISSHQIDPSEGKEKGKSDEDEDLGSTVKTYHHRRSESQAHRRQRSSVTLVSGTSASHGLLRPSVVGLFDEGSETRRSSLSSTRESSPNSGDDERGTGHDEHRREAISRLSTFSFGAKPSGSTVPPRRKQHFRGSSQSIFGPELASLGSPPASPNRLSTPSSRPPSLMLTRPSPSMLGSPSPISGDVLAVRDGEPSSPPTPVKKKRHSHTRSNSISLPNLKLQNAAARPNSLNVPISPGFGSPISPTSSTSDVSSRPRLTGPITGQRLKFEPSGRGAEAELDRQESRRRALEKLTGSTVRSRSPAMDTPVAEISLPDLDDEDSSSVASSNRPLSGAFSWSTHSSLTMPSLSANSPTPSPLSSLSMSWTSPSDDRSPTGPDKTDRWSGFSFGLSRDPSPASANNEDSSMFGMDFGAALAKRPSINRQLSALQEVDESEEDELEEDADDDPSPALATAVPMSIISPSMPAKVPNPPSDLVFSPTGLRQLKLTSSLANGESLSSADSIRTFTFPHTSSASPPTTAMTAGPSSPTKNYGAIGRGRPTPSDVSTPKHSGAPPRRRTTPSSGSIGSSISYVKDDSSSSRDLTINIRATNNPPQSVTSPSSFTSSPTKGNLRWGNSAGRGARPCPRPKGLLGAVSGRVLGEVDEMDEENTPEKASSRNRPESRRLSLETTRTSSELSRDGGRESLDRSHWRDVQLDMERENGNLRDEVDHWRTKCAMLEEKLNGERKDGIILRERVRKLGDRLSSISSIPTERPSDAPSRSESRLIIEMREQLFNLTTKLEQEKRGKDLALERLRGLRDTLPSKQEDPAYDLAGRSTPATSESASTPIMTPPQLDLPVTPAGPPFSYPLPPVPHFTSTESKRLTPDLASRFRGWGFPTAPPSQSQSQSHSQSQSIQSSKTKKRESFFGLSNPLMMRSVSDDGPRESHEQGVDLPAFIVHGGDGELFGQVDGRRVVSEPAAAPALFGLPPVAKMSSASAMTATQVGRSILEGCGGKMDFRKGCRCCIGEIIEV